jgi:hypothetical protein
LAVLAVIRIAAITKRINFGSREQIANVLLRGKSIRLAAAFASAIAAGKPTTAS